MRDGQEEYARRGVTVAIVTMGEPEETAAFCEGVEAPFVCLSDPGKRAYRAFGLGRGGVREMLNLRSLAAGARATLGGHTQGRTVGDPWQMPGAFVFDGEGVFRYAHRADNASDNPTNDELLRVLDAL